MRRRSEDSGVPVRYHATQACAQAYKRGSLSSLLALPSIGRQAGVSWIPMHRCPNLCGVKLSLCAGGRAKEIESALRCRAASACLPCELNGMNGMNYAIMMLLCKGLFQRKISFHSAAGEGK